MCLGPLSCWKVNLLPSLRFWMLWTRFSLRLSLYFGALSFSSTLTSPSVPAAEKQLHSTSTLYFWDCTATCDEQCLLSLKHNAWNCGSSDQRILFLTVWGSFRCFFANSKCVFMWLHWREDWVLPHCHKAQIDGVLQLWLSFCRFLLSAYHGAQLEWPSGSLSPL